MPNVLLIVVGTVVSLMILGNWFVMYAGPGPSLSSATDIGLALERNDQVARVISILSYVPLAYSLIVAARSAAQELRDLVSAPIPTTSTTPTPHTSSALHPVI